MTERKISKDFIVRMQIRNDAGEVVGEKELVTFAGLLALAHETGLDRIETELVQAPCEANQMTAIVRAVVQGKRGVYSGIGDATPFNVSRRVTKHLLRVAETRAKARALRDYTNVAVTSLEEMGEDDDLEAQPPQQPAQAQQRASHSRQPQAGKGNTRNTLIVAADRGRRERTGITDAQRRMLWRLALALGYEGEAARAFITQRLGCQPEQASRSQASGLIDELSNKERAQKLNGGGHAAA